MLGGRFAAWKSNGAFTEMGRRARPARPAGERGAVAELRGLLRTEVPWRDGIGASVARWDGIALIIAAVLVLFRLATYDAYADGPWGRHATATLAGAILAGALWIAVKLRTPMRSAVPAVTALLVMLSGDVVHLLRWTHPLTRQGQVVVYEETFRSSALAPQRWATQTEGEGEARVEDGKFILQNGPEAAAFVDLNLGDEEDGGRPLGPWFGRAILPVDYGTWLTKRVSWSASVQLAGTYYTVLELVEHRVLIQAVASGLLVSYPGETAEMASAFVSGPDLSDGTEHVWTVVQSPVRLAVYLDEQVVVERPAGTPLDFLRLGGSRVDPEHAGSITLARVQEVWQRPATT